MWRVQGIWSLSVVAACASELGSNAAQRAHEDFHGNKSQFDPHLTNLVSGGKWFPTFYSPAARLRRSQGQTWGFWFVLSNPCLHPSVVLAGNPEHTRLFPGTSTIHSHNLSQSRVTPRYCINLDFQCVFLLQEWFLVLFPSPQAWRPSWVPWSSLWRSCRMWWSWQFSVSVSLPSLGSSCSWAI